MVALRRPPPVCVGSPFGSLHPVIPLSLGYINLSAPIGRRPSTFTTLLHPGQSPPARPSPRPQRHQTAASRPASWFKSVPLTDDRPPSVPGASCSTRHRQAARDEAELDGLFLAEREAPKRVSRYGVVSIVWRLPCEWCRTGCSARRAGTAVPVVMLG